MDGSTDAQTGQQPDRCLYGEFEFFFYEGMDTTTDETKTENTTNRQREDVFVCDWVVRRKC